MQQPRWKGLAKVARESQLQIIDARSPGFLQTGRDLKPLLPFLKESATVWPILTQLLMLQSQGASPLVKVPSALRTFTVPLLLLSTLN